GAVALGRRLRQLPGLVPAPRRRRGDLGVSRPGALTASLNWYRATLPPPALVEPALEVPPVARPTMGIWSKDDMALIEANVTGSAAHVNAEWRYERIDGGGHWSPVGAAGGVG